MQFMTYTQESLEDELYKDVVQIAKKLGIPARGKKVELIEKILEKQKEGGSGTTTTTAKKTSPDTSSSTKSAPPKRGRGSSKAKDASDSESEEEEEEKQVASDPESDESSDEEAKRAKKRPTPAKPAAAAPKKQSSKAAAKSKVVESDDEDEEEEEEEEDNTTTTSTTSTTSTSTSNVVFNNNGATSCPLKKWTMEGGEAYYYLEEPISRSKIVAFDMDDTIVHTKSGAKFAKTRTDWVYWADCVPIMMKEYYTKGYQIIIVTNQGGIGVGSQHDRTKFSNVSGKIQDLFKEWGIPCIAIMACDLNGKWRKPNKLMWNFLVEDCTNGKVTINSKDCLYVGDAAGRPDNWKAGKKKDFASSDLGFALSSGIAFKTPEEFFLGEAPFVDKSAAVSATGIISNDKIPKVETTGDVIQGGGNILPKTKVQELVLMCGFPASGKSTFSKTHFVPAGYVHVNRDTLKTKEKCIKVCKESLAQGLSVVIDNTNPAKTDRLDYIKLAKQYGVPVRCFRMQTPLELAQHLNYYRERTQGVKHVPGIGYNMFKKNFVEPHTSEGYEEIKYVNFVLKIQPDQVKEWNIPKPK
ncbi:hypothetical protein DFA_06934 [Cavenderia fasciculata]|uniref:SAP DNA-binding domain-containing protein n=1 Tax=Cavenderia fasciculata TaxID=261658 RepID=F4PX29_CACFS|nr:uncharacterized protein DFA_06934 [Cavenderia fasciculata]EGG19832.1 hypothetical protein DFA_06934 [Cavenderia fasciculata]|eukprot:XP_004358178.1 hypothetical protein DFA_06934 [Cavenderia fasciculata]